MWLRTASPNDIEAIYAILRESWHEAYDDLIGRAAVETITADWYDPMQLAQEINQPEAEYIVADDGTKLYGVAYALSGAVAAKPDAVLIRQLCVRPSHQNQGLGAQLLEEIESCFPAARRFQVRVLEKNERALQFFTHRFYERVAEDASEQVQTQFFELLLEKAMNATPS